MPLDTSSIYGIGKGFNDSAATASNIKNQYLQYLINQQNSNNQSKLIPSEIDLRKAQTESINKKNQLPFGGENLPGVSGQIVGLQMLKGLYGENSDQYKQAIQAFKLDQLSDQSRINYQNILANTAPQRSLTPQGKLIVEESNVQQGNMPTGATWNDQQMAPGSPNDLAQGYQLLRQKSQSDPQARARALSASNIDKTINMINPDDLTRYAGTNALKKGLEEIKAPFGGESKEYKNYSKALQNSELLSTQVRQFYGDSIQPAMLERLQRITNPSTWKNNPELAKSLFNELTKVLKAETKTYRDALITPEAYQENINLNQNNPSEGVIQQTKNIDGQEYALINNVWHKRKS